MTLFNSGSHDTHKKFTGVSCGQTEGLSGRGEVAVPGGRLPRALVAVETATGGRLFERSAHVLLGQLGFRQAAALVVAGGRAAATSC